MRDVVRAGIDTPSTHRWECLENEDNELGESFPNRILAEVAAKEHTLASGHDTAVWRIVAIFERKNLRHV